MKSRIVSLGMTGLGKFKLPATELMYQALIKSTIKDSWNAFDFDKNDIDTVIAIPSLSEPHFMMAHYFSTKYNIFKSRSEKNKTSFSKTIDLGGAGPISAVIEADRLIKSGQSEVVAIVAGDAIGSMPTSEFLKAADNSCLVDESMSKLKSPIIPNGYNRIAEWYLDKGHINREQLGMVSVLMSLNAVNHPFALTKNIITLEEVLNTRKISTLTSIYECAHRTDGGASIIIASDNYLNKIGIKPDNFPYIKAGEESSGPLYPPNEINELTYNSCYNAVDKLYKKTNLTVDDIDYFGLYDCFPICFVRAVDAVGLHKKKKLWTKQMKSDLKYTESAGKWIEGIYELSKSQGNFLHPFQFPVNTHGGLLCFGAPWEVPALFNVIEAAKQLRGIARKRQIPFPKRALIYGNGGILSASSIVLLEIEN